MHLYIHIYIYKYKGCLTTRLLEKDFQKGDPVTFGMTSTCDALRIAFAKGLCFGGPLRSCPMSRFCGFASRQQYLRVHPPPFVLNDCKAMPWHGMV